MSKTKAAGPGHYEILFIIANEYTEEEAKKISQDVEGIINKHKGEMSYKEFWGKKKLAYPIKHNHFGYYSLLEFDLETEGMPELNETLRLFDKIIRFQIIKTRKRTLEEINAEKAKQESLSKSTGDKEDNEQKKGDKNSDKKDEKKITDINTKENKEKDKEDKKEMSADEKKKEAKKKEKAEKDSLKDLDDKLNNILDAQDLIK
jgi:small subunit ribosomal protein S6